MPSIVIELDPNLLVNADADLRYLLPDRIVERSNGLVTDDGYDYTEDGRMLLFLRAPSLAPATALVLDVVLREELLGSSFRSAVVAVTEADGAAADGSYRVVHPPHLAGTLLASR